MRPVSIEDIPLVDGLSKVISRYGFEGASLSLLSEAVGLKRASLYHRFPGGKEQMLQAVLDRASERFDRMVAPAYEAGDPIERATLVANGIDDYYNGGEESCLIVALSLGNEPRPSAAAPCLEEWANALANIAVDAGLPPDKAAERALDIVARIEGAVVISASTGDRGPFRRAIDRLPADLTEPIDS